MLLAGDVGGTKTRLALFEQSSGTFVRGTMAQFESKSASGLDVLIRRFLSENNVSVDRACFGIPGPVIKGVVKVTNLPWRLAEQELSVATGIKHVRLVNDLVATSGAIPYLTAEDVAVLHHGAQRTDDVDERTYGILAPGTGLGQGYAVRRNGKFHAMPSEGGHADFAPNNEIEDRLLVYLRKRLGHVSFERVLSGPGIVNIYQFLRDEHLAEEPPELARRMAEEAPAALISRLGERGENTLCVKTLDVFSSILGAHAGSWMLSLMAVDGIYLGGGIPPKLLRKLSDGTATKAYLEKGRFREIVKGAPLVVIKDDHAALLGAAHFAAEI